MKVIKKLTLLSFLLLMLTGCAITPESNEIGMISALPATAAGDQASNWPDTISIETWDGIRNKSIRSLTRHTNFPASPTRSTSITYFDIPSTQTYKYGRRISAILTPSTDGSYLFWLSANDSAELWISSDEKPYNKKLIAFVNKATGYQEWNKYNSQKSKTLLLKAGKEYFLEVLHKQHIDDDHLSISWQGPNFTQEILTDKYLSGYSEKNNSNTGQYALGYLSGYNSGVYLLPYDDRYPIHDQDKDGLPDQYEIAVGLDPLNPADALSDNDNDLLSAIEEYQAVGNPNNRDTDNDGLPDGYELLYGLSLLNPLDAGLDFDGDGASNLEEYTKGTDPTDSNETPIPTLNIATLTWEVPEQRADGSELTIEEIASYKIYWGTSPTDLINITEAQGATTTSYTYQQLNPGSYYFAISVIDINGLESELSNSVIKKIE